MKPIKTLISISILFLLLSACNLPLAGMSQTTLTPGSPVTSEPPLPATEPPTAPPTASPMTLEMLKNATYMLPFYGRTVTLANGVFTEGSGAEIYSVSMSDFYAFGDLNGDGLEDAAVILFENGGGTGVFEAVIVMLNQNGAPVQAGAAQLGDRVLVNSLTIQDGRILLDMVMHGPNDPMCCPTEPVTQAYQLFTNGLFLMHATTKVSNGAEHIITIISPASNAEVTNPVTISGTITISPFENTLVYRLYNAANVQVAEAPFMVQAVDIGSPGTFTFTFDLTSAGVTGLIRVEILDISMADGSTIALDAINLLLK